FTKQKPPLAGALKAGQAELAPHRVRGDLPERLAILLHKMMLAKAAERCASVSDARAYLDWVFEAEAQVVDGAGRFCRRCRKQSRAGLDICAHCGADLHRRTLTLGDARPATVKRLEATSVETSTQVTAWMRPAGSWLSFFTGTSEEPVMVVSITPQQIVFESRRALKIPSVVPMRLRVPAVGDIQVDVALHGLVAGLHGQRYTGSIQRRA
ncbi:MAG TPA: hypothetical protein VGO93_14040, partial [Candidatus Xenobia bacterium]